MISGRVATGALTVVLFATLMGMGSEQPNTLRPFPRFNASDLPPSSFVERFVKPGVPVVLVFDEGPPTPGGAEALARVLGEDCADVMTSALSLHHSYFVDEINQPHARRCARGAARAPVPRSRRRLYTRC